MSEVTKVELVELAQAVRRFTEETEASFTVLAKFHGASLHELNFSGRDPATYDCVNGNGFMPDATEWARALQGRIKAQRALTALVARLEK